MSMSTKASDTVFSFPTFWFSDRFDSAENTAYLRHD